MPRSRKEVLGWAAFWTLFAALMGFGVWYFHWGIRVPGDAIGDVALPGALDLDLAEGDRVRFTTQSDVTYRLRPDLPSSEDGFLPPRGCQLDVELTMGPRTASARCDFYYESETWNPNTDATQDADGDTRHAKAWNTRTGCLLTAPATGRAHLQMTTTLAACVPKVSSAGVRVYRERATASR